MKRIAVLSLLASTVAVGAGASASWGGSAPAEAQVTIVHAATYDAGNDFPVTVCSDGALLDDDFRVGQQLGPIGVPAGTLNAQIFVGAGGDCSGDPAIEENLPIEAGDDVVVAAIWNAEGPALTSFDFDRSCVDPGNARVSALHAATAGTVDVWAGPAGGDLAPLIPDFAEGAYAGPLDVPAGSYDIAVFPAGADPSGTPAIAVDGLPLGEASHTVIYAIGGNDGDLGAFALEADVALCEVPVEETTPTTVATGPAEATPPPAQPVAASPSYTG